MKAKTIEETKKTILADMRFMNEDIEGQYPKDEYDEYPPEEEEEEEEVEESLNNQPGLSEFEDEEEMEVDASEMMEPDEMMSRATEVPGEMEMQPDNIEVSDEISEVPDEVDPVAVALSAESISKLIEEGGLPDEMSAEDAEIIYSAYKILNKLVRAEVLSGDEPTVISEEEI